MRVRGSVSLEALRFTKHACGTHYARRSSPGEAAIGMSYGGEKVHQRLCMV